MMLCLLLSRLMFASAFEMRLVDGAPKHLLSEQTESKSQNEERGVWYIIRRSVLRKTIQASIQAKGSFACMLACTFLKSYRLKGETSRSRKNLQTRYFVYLWYFSSLYGILPVCDLWGHSNTCTFLDFQFHTRGNIKKRTLSILP
jgi:hypothetical protein